MRALSGWWARVAAALLVACLAPLLGIGAAGASASQTVIAAGATAISAGYTHDCALLADRTAQCWGDNGDGQLGNGATNPNWNPSPVTVAGLSDVTAIAAGRGGRSSGHTCALLDDGTARCWGSNGWGQLGDGSAADSPTAAVVAGLGGGTGISSGGAHTCALLDDGTARCWGDNNYGQLGNEPPAAPSFLFRSDTPVPVGLSDILEIGAGGENTCALVGDGTARCWGNPEFGRLGDGLATHPFHYVSDPAVVAGLDDAVAIGVGGFVAGGWESRRGHACALLDDGSARCWGNNDQGQLGDGTTKYNSATPVAVAGLSDATAISAGSLHACALLDDGTARCWGDDGEGQLGDGTAGLDSYAPVNVNLSGILEISAGAAHTCALLSGGSVTCWGAGYGPLEAPSEGPAASPSQAKSSSPSPAPPTVRITSHPPRETADPGAVFTFTGAAGGSYECSVDADGWRPCGSGEDFGPLPPGDHRFRVRQTVGGLTGPADSYSWTIALPRQCVLRVARARVFVSAQRQRVRLVIRYKAYRPADVTVSYSLVGARGPLELGSASSHFTTADVFRLPERLNRQDLAKVREARQIKVQFRIPRTPQSCGRYYTKRLTIPRKVSGQTVWFQSDSIFTREAQG